MVCAGPSVQKNNSHSAGKRNDLIKALNVCFFNYWNSEIPSGETLNCKHELAISSSVFRKISNRSKCDV